LRSSAGGPAGWAIMVPPGDNRIAWVLLIDTRGKSTARKALRDQLERSTQAAEGTVATSAADDLGAGRELTTYTAREKPKVFHLEFDEMWIISNDREVLPEIVGRWGKAASDALIKLPSYRYIAEQTKPAAGETVDIQWFVQPFMRAEAARLVTA